MIPPGWLAERHRVIVARRVAAIFCVEELQRAGKTKTRAIELVARDLQVGPSTIATWFRRVAGVARADRHKHLWDKRRWDARGKIPRRR